MSAANGEDSSTRGFSEQERAAITERAAELKAETTRGRALAERIHTLVAHNAPGLSPQALVRAALLRPRREGRVLLPQRRRRQGALLDRRPHPEAWTTKVVCARPRSP